MLWLSVFVCGVKGGWVGVGWGWVCCGIFLCQKYPVNSFSLLYYKQLFWCISICAYINCFRATGVHNSWAPVWCVFVSVSAHSFMVSFFSIFRGSFIAGLLFSLLLLVDTCCLVTVKYCLYTISQFKYAHTWSINHMYRVVERKQGNKYWKTKKKKIKTHYLDLRCSKMKAAHPVNYFPGFLGKYRPLLRIAHPVNYSYLPPWSNVRFGLHPNLWHPWVRSMKTELVWVSSPKKGSYM